MDNKIDLYFKSLILEFNNIDINLIFTINDYFQNNRQSLLSNSDIISFIFKKIKEYDYVKYDINKADLISYLIRCYLKSNSATDDIIYISILQTHDIEEIEVVFNEDEYFAKTIIDGYLNYLLNPSYKYNDNLTGLILKFSKDYKISFISDILRNNLFLLIKQIDPSFNNYPLFIPFLYAILSEKSHIYGNNDIEYLSNEIKRFYPIFIRIAYADVYEYVLVNSNIAKANAAKEIIEKALNTNEYGMQYLSLEEVATFIYFYLLALQTRINHFERLASLGKEEILTLQEINPLYLFEESDIMKKG